MPAPEMIRFITKKFSTHTLREVKPGPSSDQLKLQGHNPGQDADIKDRADAAERWSLESAGSLIEEDFEDEEISTINLSQAYEGKTAAQKHSPKNLEQETGRFPSEQRLKQHSLRHVTPPLKQFEMRLPDIEVERKHPVTIKPKKCTRRNKQFLKSLESHSQCIRRPAFQDYSKDTTRPSAFVRIPHIEVAKIHPRSEKSREIRNLKDSSVIPEKSTVSKGKSYTVMSRELPRKDKQRGERNVEDQTCHSDSEISEATEYIPKTSSIARTGSFTGKKSPTFSYHERVNSEIPPTLRIGTLTSSFREQSSPPLRLSPPPLRISPSPRDHVVSREISGEMSRDFHVTREAPRDLNLTREAPREFLRDVTPREHIRERTTPSPRFEYKCFTTLSTSHENEKLSANLVENIGKRFTPISSKEVENLGKRFTPISSKERIRRDDDARKSNGSIDKFFIERLKEGTRSPPHKINIERVSMGGTSNRGCWERSDVEMAETIEEDRNSWHRDRLNNELKRKHSVLPADEEVRNICGTSSNFKAFVISSNPSQSGPNHRTIDISVVQPNKRVCCTESPPSLRRPSINVEKMAQAVLVRRPVVRKAGAPSIVWSTKEDMVRPIPLRPPSSPRLQGASPQLGG